MIHAIAMATQVQADLAMRGRVVLLTMAPVDLLMLVQEAHVIQVLVVVNTLALVVLLTTVRVVRDTLALEVPLTMARAVLLTMALGAHAIRALGALVIQALAEEINVLRFAGRKFYLLNF